MKTNVQIWLDNKSNEAIDKMVKATKDQAKRQGKPELRKSKAAIIEQIVEKYLKQL